MPGIEITVTAKRIGSDVHLKLSLWDSGVSIAWDTVEVKQVCMYSVEQKAFAGHCSFAVDREDNHILNATYPASEQLYLGDHRVVVRLNMDGSEATYDALAFTLKSYTDAEGPITTNPVEIGINVEEVDTTIMHEILAACQAATDAALAAETAIAIAEAARVAAENLRVAAENARVAAEAARQNAESLRESAETDRVNAENARVVAETARVEAENLRKTAEEARQAAEFARADAENARAEAEAARVEAENLRAAAENARITAENARADAENARVAAENARAAAENARNSAEGARQTAEAGRVEAENLRVAAEALREQNCRAAIADLTAAVNALTLGLFSIIAEDGELKAVYNVEGSVFAGGGVSEDGELYLDFDVQ